MASFREQLIAHLGQVGRVSHRPLMGGSGLYVDGAHFGIVQGDRLYFLADSNSREDYKRLGMAAFDPNPKQPFGAFYEVPEHVLDDRDLLLEWARRAVKAAAAP